MTKTLLASAALMFAIALPSFAAAPAYDKVDGFKAKTEYTDTEAKRRKKRVPGGSGCDDPRDVIEHPECKPAASLKDGEMHEADELLQEAKRRKKRVPGGSGCDDPRDVIQHPECRV